MKRKDAEALIGTRVSAWTAMNGEYVGTLIGVSGSPWRGTVLITGATGAPAFEWSRGDRQRRGFRAGMTIEVGGANIRLCDAEGADMSAVMATELSDIDRLLADPVMATSPHRYLLEARRKNIAEKLRVR